MIRALLTLCIFWSPISFAEDDWTHYGNEFTLTDAPIPATELLADPSQFDGKKIMVEGRVADVCQKAGCWLVLAEGDKSIRVRTKAHKFLVAKDTTGYTARIEGEVRSHKIDPKKVAHYEGESVNKEIIPEKQVQSDTTYELIAFGIAMQPKQSDGAAN